MDPRILAHRNPLRLGALLALVGLVLGLGLAAVWPKTTVVSLAFTVDQRKRQETPDYTYDGYYALQASQLFTDTLISWFGTPSTVAEMYTTAGLPMPKGDANVAAAGFRMKRLSSQVVTARFTAPNATSGQALALAAAKVVEAKTAELGRDAQGDSLFAVTADEPAITTSKLPLATAGLAGLVLGALAAYVLWFAGAEKKKGE